MDNRAAINSFVVLIYDVRYIFIGSKINKSKKQNRRKNIFFILSLVITLLEIYLKESNFYYKNYKFYYLKYIWYFNQLKFIKYLGYFIMGYSLKRKVCNFKITIIISIIFLMLIIGGTEFIIRKNIFNETYLYDNNLPFVMFGSIFFI